MLLNFFKKIFLIKADTENIDEAESSFDDLMKELDKDESDLKMMENHVYEEFSEISDELEAINKKMDCI